MWDSIDYLTVAVWAVAVAGFSIAVAIFYLGSQFAGKR